ncbi:MAG: hypothetical protein HY787_06965 [Deltaproteobacteria bacterium]|nr:hypothetical protein [Deltaproteobacteria bacterium]
MPIQLSIWERRDSGRRETMGNIALELCRLCRKSEGITSTRFYWSGSDEIVFLFEGEAAALDTPDQKILADYAWLGFVLADQASQILNKRLIDPKTGLQIYRIAGRYG